jgi:hypothetical protein
VYFFPLGVTNSSTFYTPLLSLNLCMARGLSDKTVEGKRHIALFLWNGIMVRGKK